MQNKADVLLFRSSEASHRQIRQDIKSAVAINHMKLRKLTDSFPSNLISLAAIVCIAVALPLLHPVVHSHLEPCHAGGHSDDCAGHVSAMWVEGNDVKCSICDFLAINSIFETGIGPIVPEIEPLGKMVSFNEIFFTKNSLLPTEPRAPPVFASL